MPLCAACKHTGVVRTGPYTELTCGVCSGTGMAPALPNREYKIAHPFAGHPPTAEELAEDSKRETLVPCMACAECRVCGGTHYLTKKKHEEIVAKNVEPTPPKRPLPPPRMPPPKLPTGV